MAWCYLRWKPLVPSGPRGVLITSTPGGGGDGNTPDAVAPGGNLTRTLRSFPLALSLWQFFTLFPFWLSLMLFACNLSCKQLKLSSMTSSGLRASPSIRNLASSYSFCLCWRVLTGRAFRSPFSCPLASVDGRFRIRIAGSGITHWDPIQALSSTITFVTLQPFSGVFTDEDALDISLIFVSNWNRLTCVEGM